MNFLSISPGHPTPLADEAGFADAVHVFDQPMIDAVNTALAAGRPLLVRGEPGTGKSQLARAAAKELRRAFVSKVIDVRTEARDLLWHFDAIARLGEAQLLGALGNGDKTRVEGLRAELAEWRFLSPGPLFWAFDWECGARLLKENRRGEPPPRPPEWQPKQGTVLLLDEIDKAESDVPNGLLEALGDRRFVPPGWPPPYLALERAERSTPHRPGLTPVIELLGTPPLVVITTNEERALPDAFVRRCLVLVLTFPEKELLIARGAQHFKDLSASVRLKAAEMLLKERARQIEANVTPPGQAEYLDLLRALDEHRKVEKEKGQSGEALDQWLEALLNRVAGFALRKQNEPSPSPSGSRG